MNVTQLENFVRVVDLRNMSKAAEAIGIVQPALSRQIRALEAELGVRLLARHNWGVAPTRAGETLAASARRILGDLQNAREEVHALEHEPAGMVTVAAASSLASAFFPPLVASVARRYPKVRLRLLTLLTADLMTGLHSGAIDIAIVQRSRSIAGLTVLPLLTDRFGLIGPPAILDPLTDTSPATLAQLPLILPSAPNPLRTQIEILLGDREPWVLAEVDGLAPTLDILADGLGCAVLPLCAAEPQVRAGLLRFLPLEGPGLIRDVVLARNVRNTPSRASYVIEEELAELTAALAPRMTWTPAP